MGLNENVTIGNVFTAKHDVDLAVLCAFSQVNAVFHATGTGACQETFGGFASTHLRGSHENEVVSSSFVVGPYINLMEVF
jgi:sugar phosphate permease